MVWTLESVTEALGDKAQFTARGIVVVDYNELSVPKHVLIAEFVGEDTFCVTADGSEYLKDYETEDEAPKSEKPAAKNPAAKKAAAKKAVAKNDTPVGPAPEVTETAVDDGSISSVSLD